MTECEEFILAHLDRKTRSYWLMKLGLIETAWISSSAFVLYYTEKEFDQIESYWISAGYSTGNLDGI